MPRNDPMLLELVLEDILHGIRSVNPTLLADMDRAGAPYERLWAWWNNHQKRDRENAA